MDHPLCYVIKKVSHSCLYGIMVKRSIKFNLFLLCFKRGLLGVYFMTPGCILDNMDLQLLGWWASCEAALTCWSSRKLSSYREIGRWLSSSIDVYKHYYEVILSAMACQIASLTIVYSTVYSSTYQRKHQSSAWLAFVRGTRRWPGEFPVQRDRNEKYVKRHHDFGKIARY